MKRTIDLVAEQIPRIARWLHRRGRVGSRCAFAMMAGRCSVCGIRVQGWKPGDFYACDEHLEQVRQRWIVSVGHAAATEKAYETRS